MEGTNSKTCQWTVKKRRIVIRASTINVPNAKYLAHLAHQIPKNFIYEMFQIL